MQTPFLQTRLMQSLPFRHNLVFGQAGHTDPPQSTSDSSWFRIVSLHGAAEIQICLMRQIRYSIHTNANAISADSADAVTPISAQFGIRTGRAH